MVLSAINKVSVYFIQMKTKLLTILCFVVLGSALHVNHLATLSAGKITLQSDTGKYLARCNGCGPASYADSAAIHETNPNNPWAIFTVIPRGNQVALRADNGNYLSRCNSCWRKSAYPDSAFVHVTESNQGAYSLWTPEQLPNGNWVFRSDTGNYLARCNGCVTGGTTPDYAFVHEKDKNQGYAQWKINYVLPAGKINLQSDTGKYLARCNGCGPASYADSAAIHETNPNNPWAIFTVIPRGNQVALRADNGNYLSRCNSCWRKSAYPDSAFVHVTESNQGAYSLWTPEQLPNGNWVFRSDTGNYLARCNGCVTGGTTPDYAFVHEKDKNQGYAQWKVNFRS